MRTALYGFIGCMAATAITVNATAREGRMAMVKDAQSVVVYAEGGKFMGWPANNGAWIFQGDEMLVGFTRGDYKLGKGHNIGGNQLSWLARSTDGGHTWKAYDPDNYVGDYGDTPILEPVVEPIRFTHPKFAMRVVGTAYHGAYDPRGHFFHSYDGGLSWNGPHGFGGLDKASEILDSGLSEMTPRTDYLVEGEHQCLLFISVRNGGEFGSDRLFCARTTDGGKTFQFVGWVVPPSDDARAVMSQSLEMPDGKLICAMRRRQDAHNWVDAYMSADKGRTWTFQAEVGDAGAGNGNPPALNVTEDGRLVAVFGNREKPGQILTVHSDDEGKTWSEPLVLRDDFGSEDMETNDLGYPRLLRRADGLFVALYYWSTRETLHHIAATIWNPSDSH